MLNNITYIIYSYFFIYLISSIFFFPFTSWMQKFSFHTLDFN